LTWQASTRNKFSFHYEWEKRCDCHHLQGNNANFQGLSAGEATDFQIFQPADMFQSEWTFPATNKLLFNGGVQLSRPTYRTNFRPDLSPDAVAIVDDVTGQRWGADSGTAYQVPSHRNKIEPRFSATYVTGSHAFKAGFNLIHDWGQLSTNAVPGNMNWTYHSGVPTTIIEFGTPYTIRENMKAELGVYGQDQWTLKRLTMNPGLRFDYVKLDVPAQSLEATQLRPFVVNTNR
jgi:outer membrane receptor for Fe3+-dicitrate